ncbi:MAG: hypothetical protein AAB656_00475 [Patescibacteria group bacterium]
MYFKIKKIYKIILFVLVFFILLFGIYFYKLHALALEGNKIFEYRCTNVNPQLISYKNSFLKFADYLKNPNKYTDDEVKSFLDGYIMGMRDYVDEENKWLEMQGNFMNRWDFKFVEPDYLKEAGGYQWKMYEGYRDEAVYMLATYDNGATEEITAKFKEARDRRSKYVGLYEDIFDREAGRSDWRKYFGSVPVPEKCNDSNLIIPDTSGALDQQGPTPNFVPNNDGAAS